MEILSRLKRSAIGLKKSGKGEAAMTREEGVFFESFYRLHFQKLVGYAYRFLKNWDDAKEVVQEAFLTGMVKIDRFYGSENRLGWIKNVIRNKAQNLNTVKKSRATVTISIEDTNLCPSAFDYYVGVDAPSAHCAELLSEQEFLLIQRIFMEGEPYRNVAKEFDLSEGACRKRVERIIKKLRKNWDIDYSS